MGKIRAAVVGYGNIGKYSVQALEAAKDFEIADKVFVIGDGSGITRGLSQAGAQGMYVADVISKK